MSYVRRDGQRVELPLLHRNKAQLQPAARKVRKFSASRKTNEPPLGPPCHQLEAAGVQLDPELRHVFALEPEAAQYLGSYLAELTHYAALSNEAAADKVDPERWRQV